MHLFLCHLWVDFSPNGPVGRQQIRTCHAENTLQARHWPPRLDESFKTYLRALRALLKKHQQKPNEYVYDVPSLSLSPLMSWISSSICKNRSNSNSNLRLQLYLKVNSWAMDWACFPYFFSHHNMPTQHQGPPTRENASWSWKERTWGGQRIPAGLKSYGCQKKTKEARSLCVLIGYWMIQCPSHSNPFRTYLYCTVCFFFIFFLYIVLCTCSHSDTMFSHEILPTCSSTKMQKKPLESIGPVARNSVP